MRPGDAAVVGAPPSSSRSGDCSAPSTTVAGSPATVAANHALLDSEADERVWIRADLTAGVRYDIVAGDTSYTEWVAERKRDEHPGQ